MSETRATSSESSLRQAARFRGYVRRYPFNTHRATAPLWSSARACLGAFPSRLRCLCTTQRWARVLGQTNSTAFRVAVDHADDRGSEAPSAPEKAALFIPDVDSGARHSTIR